MKLGIICPSHDANGVKRVADLGLKYTEMDINADDISYLDTPSIKAALKEYGVTLSAVGRWGRFRILPDGGFSEKEYKDETDLIDFCHELSCPVYITGINYVDGISYFANITAAVGYIKKLMDYAAQYKIKVCVYNCHWHNYIDNPKEWDIVLGHLDELGIKFDPSHTINGGRDYMSEAVKYGGRFDHVHIKGTINTNGERFDDPPAGLDSINWGALLSILRKHGYDGMLSIEPHSETWQGELGEWGVKYTIDYVRSLLVPGIDD